MPFAVLLAISFVIVTLLPLYLEPTMRRVWFVNGRGGAVECGWKFCTMRSYYADYPHMEPEQKPALWLAVNIGLAVSYASAVALSINAALRRKSV